MGLILCLQNPKLYPKFNSWLLFSLAVYNEALQNKKVNPSIQKGCTLTHAEKDQSNSWPVNL